MKKIEYFEMDYDELNDIIRGIYGVEAYDFVADEEASNDSTHTTNLDGEPWDSDDEEVEEFIENGSGNFMWGRLMNDLCYFEILEPGDYIIRVCW